MSSSIRFSIVVYLGLLLAGTLGAASPDVGGSEPADLDWPVVLAEPPAPPALAPVTPPAPQRDAACPEHHADHS